MFKLVNPGIRVRHHNGLVYRSVSTSVTFTAIEKLSPSSKSKPHKLGKLKVPLLKSPSHLGHFTSRVNRLYNEDKYSANVLTLPVLMKETKSDSRSDSPSDSVSLDGGRTVFNFNIFDGHGGEQCSNFLHDNLSQVIELSSDLCDPKDASVRDELIKKYWKNIGGYWKRWYKHKQDNFLKMLDSSSIILLSGLPDTLARDVNGRAFKGVIDDLAIRIPLLFLEADYQFFELDDNKSGSTCTSAFIETIYLERDGVNDFVFENYYFNRKSILKLTVAQVGDTKAILVDNTGEAHALTQPHHPSNPNEASRLRKYASNFFMTDSFGEERFILLANTRLFGDLNFKQMGVTAEPELTLLIVGDHQLIQSKLTKDEIAQHTVAGLGGDESMLILVTDGVTNVLTDQEIADIVMVNVNNQGQPRATPQRCSEEVIKFVEYIGGDDNATCLVIRLNGWGKWPNIDRTGELRQERLNDYSPRGER